MVSSGIGCGDLRYPGIYSRTDEFLTWIDDAVYGACARANFQAAVVSELTDNTVDDSVFG